MLSQAVSLQHRLRKLRREEHVLAKRLRHSHDPHSTRHYALMLVRIAIYKITAKDKRSFLFLGQVLEFENRLYRVCCIGRYVAQCRLLSHDLMIELNMSDLAKSLARQP